jgi:hypothetical protein
LKDAINFDSNIMWRTDIDSSFFIFLSDLANLVNIAAIKAAVEGADKLNASQLEFAKDRIIMGTERKSMFISDESKKASCCFLGTLGLIAIASNVFVNF